MSKSLAQIVADLPEDEREAVLADLDQGALLYDWGFWGRPEQHTPPGNWNLHIAMAGRGFGKSRMGSEWIRELGKDTRQGKLNIGLVARTAADARDVMVEGPSGIMAVCPPSEIPLYEPSKRRLTFPSGNTATLFTADEPNNLRGPNFHFAWGDEAAAWRRLPDDSGLTAWDNLRIATRLGDNPQILLTTTPKRVPMMFDLLKEKEEHPERIHITRGSTMDNAGNLPDVYVDGMLSIYGDTRVSRQELYGEMLEQVEGALWFDAMIEDARQSAHPPTPLRVIGVDPSVAENPKDECGIVVMASTGERDLYKRQAWVLEDASVLGAPQVWAQRVVDMAHKWGCPVVAEVNQGGALVTNAIHQIDPNIKVYEVHSKYGKQLRAEPVAMAYEQRRVHHVGYLAELETQMTSWVPGEGKSPDRVDALVHGLTALMIKPPPGFAGGGLTARSPNAGGPRIPLGPSFGRGGGRPGGGSRGFRVR